MTQQRQTQQYFRAAAADWQQKSLNAAGSYSVIDHRNRTVIDVIAGRNAKRFLDVGCGTGQLVVAAAQAGLQAEGNDFAQEMILQCKANADAAGVSARFIPGSFFEAQFEPQSYDVISALGFIEYISPAQTEEFFRRGLTLLKPGGSIVVGSRNRLFNAFSLNDFTRLEAELGVLLTLISEASVLQQHASIETALQALRRYERADPQPDRHPVTGIPVETRYQYTPADLIYRLRRCGLVPRTLFPVHFHGLPIAIKSDHPQLHNEIAATVAALGFRDHRLIPFCSSFVIEAAAT